MRRAATSKARLSPRSQACEELLRTAFATAEGEASDFIPADDGDVMVSVDRVMPESVRPFAEVREDLARQWTARERGRRLRRLGRRSRRRGARADRRFAAAARAHGLNVVVRVTANRPAEACATFQRAAWRRKSSRARRATWSPISRADGGAMLAVQVQRINRINPAEQPQLVEAARAQAQQALQGSVAQAMQAEIVRRACGPRATPACLSALYRRSEDGDGDEPSS